MTDHPELSISQQCQLLKITRSSFYYKPQLPSDIEAIYPKPRLSQAHPEHHVYPYLLRGLAVTQPNQVWCTDITYLPVLKGHFYLVAMMDWFSRKVLSWQISNTLDVMFCVEALQEAMSRYGTPEIFNSDQGSQFKEIPHSIAAPIPYHRQASPKGAASPTLWWEYPGGLDGKPLQTRQTPRNESVKSCRSYLPEC